MLLLKAYIYSFFTVAVLSAVTLTATSATAVQQYQYGATCADCHKMPPIDATYRNVTTGGFKGSHSTHNPPSVAPASACEKCHFGSSSYFTYHMNDFVNMTSNINSSPHPSKATYNKARFFNQTSNPVMQTCSNVNCHFETVTPAWNSTQFSSPANCNGCHGAAPADGSHPAAAGSGKKHGDYYTTTTASCSKCHPDHIAEAAPFNHATSAGHRGLIVAFNTGLNGGFGRYTGNVSYPNYLPSQAPPRNGTCKSTYCHSPGNKASSFDAPNNTAVWGGTLNCKGCHRADIASGSYITTGSHGGHVNKFGMQYNVIKCYKCHASTASTSMTIVDLPGHVNGQVEIAFSNTSSAAAGSYIGTLATPASPMTKAPGSAYGQCTNVYCHSTGQGDGGNWPPTYRTPTWGTGSSGDCGTCHGNQFNHVFGSTTPLTSGSHTKHLSYTLSVNYRNYERCVACHAYTRDGFDPNNCNGVMCHAPTFTKHSNYEINVNMPLYFGADAAYNGSSIPGDGYGSCSNVYCHSDAQTTPTYVTANWGGPTLDCTGCHGSASANGAGGTALSGKHQAHVNNVAVLGAGNNFHCIDCHRATVSNDTTIASTTFHVNKLINYTGRNAGGPLRYNGSTKVCSNFYCHSNGNRSALVYRSMTGSKVWTGNATLGCNGCHGNEASGEFATSATGAPNYPSGGSGSTTSNSHRKHVAEAGIVATTGCVNCHAKTVDSAAANKFKDYTAASYHLDSTVDVVFKNIGGDTGVFNADQSCSSTYCHGAAASPKWGETNSAIVPLACNNCHSANNNGPWATASAHKIHWESAALLPSRYINYSGNVSSTGSYRFSCSSCHSLSATHATGPVNANRVAEVFFSISGAGMTGSYTDAGSVAGTDNGFPWTAGTTGCNTTYCHSNGRGENGNSAVNWGTTVNSATTTRCKSCHSYTTASGSLINTYKHAKHADGNTYSFSCAKCHNLTTTNGTAIIDKSKHVNKTRNVAWDSLNSDGSTYANAATACANIYCHSQGTTFAAPYTGTGKDPVTAVTWGGGQTLGCNGCHGNGNTYTTGTYRAATPLYASGSPKGNAHQFHVDVRSGTDAGTQCLHCHNGTTTTNTSITTYANHVNEAYAVGAGGTYKDGDNISGGAVSVGSITYAYNVSASTCSNVSCHPTGLSGAKSTDVVPWNDKHTCDDCHKINLNNSSGYHHAMRNYSGSGAAYPKTIPGATAGANDVSRRCTMCHVDHATFSPNLNAANTTYGSAGNLRMSIISSVTATQGYINRDFIKTGSGGICISCHNTELFKDTGNLRVKNETNSTKTAAIVLNSYTGSAHEYAINSTMKRDSKVFYADCSKCHNSRKGEVAAFSAMTTATHGSPTRRIYADLGTTLTDGNDAQFCFRCHSKTSDAIGGTKKTVANKDYYATATMSSAAEGIFTAMDGAGVISYPTTASATLYLRNNAAINAVSPATDPAAYKYISGTYTTNTYTQRDMAPASGSTGTTTILSTGSTAVRYNRGIQFVSPQIDNAVTIPAGSAFTLTIREVRAAGTSTDYTRFTVYKWSGSTATPLNTSSAPDNFAENATAISTTATNRSTTFTTDSEVTLNPGDALICDVEFYHSAGTTALNVTYSYGNFGTDGAKLALPTGSYNWRTGAPSISKYGHNVASDSYNGLHKTSPSDETQAYLTSNRHVSCNDCHNPHAASAAAPVRGATGLTPSTPAAGGTPTYTFETITNPDHEYKICFKCHTDWAGYGTGTQNLAVAFNTNNDSFHWVETDRGAAKASTSYGNFNHTTVPTKSYTYVDAMMPRHAALTDAQLRSAKMRCSDCHGSNASDGGVSVPEGPHGSTVANILKVPAGSAYNTWNSTVNYLSNTNIWCYNCHSPSFTSTGFSTGGSNLHTSKHDDWACQYCHLAIPHGPTEVGSTNQRKRLLKPTVFTESIDSLNSGSMGQSSGHNATIPGCT